MSSAASVKARLKNQSIATGKTLQELLVAYGLERTIYRLSKSRYVENFTLKGGILLYALFDKEFARVTTDIDLLAQKISNSTEDMRQVFTEIFRVDADDPLQFDFDSLTVSRIAEFKEYHGVNISIKAYLDRTRIDVSIDIGFGDVIVPERVQMEFPVVLNDEHPKIYAYSLSSCVAEKFEAIVSLGYDNSRFKDFYDLYILAHQADFGGMELLTAVEETFNHRNTSLTDIVAFEPGFSQDPLRRTRWNAFVKKKKAMLQISLDETISLIREFLLPVADASLQQKKISDHWSHEKLMWE